VRCNTPRISILSQSKIEMNGKKRHKPCWRRQRRPWREQRGRGPTKPCASTWQQPVFTKHNTAP
jgi:hypothetical protein